MTSGIIAVAMLVAQLLQRRLVAVDHHHARAQGQHGLGAGQSDARRRARHDGDLVLQFFRHRLPPRPLGAGRLGAGDVAVKVLTSFRLHARRKLKDQFGLSASSR